MCKEIVLAIFFLFAICPIRSQAQVSAASQSWNFLFGSDDPGVVAPVINAAGATHHLLVFEEVSLNVADCLVKIEQSADGDSWSDLIAEQNCNASGQSALTLGSVNYIRLNVTNLTTDPSGELKVTWIGYSSEPQQRTGSNTTGSITTLARADVQVSWNNAFISTAYKATCTVLDTSAAGTGLSVERIRAQATGTVTVQVLNSSAGSLTGTVYCSGVWP